MITKDEINFYLKYAGKPYDKSIPELKEAGERIKKNLCQEINKISTAAAEIIFNGKYVINKLRHAIAPNDEQSKFRSYLHARIAPQSKYAPFVQYWFRIDETGFLVLGIGLKDTIVSDTLKQKFNQIRNSSNIEISYDVTDSTSNENLVEWFVDSINGFNVSYDAFCEKLQPELDNTLSKWTERENKKQKTKNEQNIWKMSHGKDKHISEDDNEWLMENNFIAIGYDPKHSQRMKFLSMRNGDLFYLVRNSKIALLGRIHGEEIIDATTNLKKQNWVMRKFQKIQSPVMELFSNQVPGRESWKPQNQSSVNVIKKEALSEFEKLILEPAFDLSLSDILEISANNQTDTSNNIEGARSVLNIILYGPPGTGKTFHTVNYALTIADPSYEFSGKTREEVKSRFDELINEGQIVFTTFHQSMSYEDFIEGIKPDAESDGEKEGIISYEIQPGIFKKICETAQISNRQGFESAYKKLQEELILLKEDDLLALSTPTGKQFSISLNKKGNLYLYTGRNLVRQGVLTKENIQKQINGEDFWHGGYFKGVIKYLEKKYGYEHSNNEPKKNYVLIIDEINRGNVSQIFGELITLIEEDKRLGRDEQIKVTLPYSKKSFGVPSNVYIIGTMNTADRSVEALDAALRRRFSFIEMAPNPEIIIKEGFNGGDISGIQLSEVLRTINRRLEKLLDKDHQIGHSYFLGVDSKEKLAKTFNNKIVPLLREYFFGDYGKIGLVLGKGFVEKTKDLDKEHWAIFDYDASDYEDKDSYQIIDINPDNIMIAIESLLPKKTENGEE